MYLQIIRQIFASDILNWIFAAIGGALAYFFLHRLQNTRERHVMIKDIEDSITALMDEQLAKANKKPDNRNLVKVNFRTVLHDFSPWIHDNIVEEMTDGQRYIVIRDDDKYYELISTALIHESLIWFRRVNKLFNDRIIKEEDLADLWRQILIFMRAKKLEFYRLYLGKDDTYAILAVCLHCIYSIIKLDRKTALKYIGDILDERALYESYLKEFVPKRLFEKKAISAENISAKLKNLSK